MKNSDLIKPTHNTPDLLSDTNYSITFPEI